MSEIDVKVISEVVANTVNKAISKAISEIKEEFNNRLVVLEQKVSDLELTVNVVKRSYMRDFLESVLQVKTDELIKSTVSSVIKDFNVVVESVVDSRVRNLSDYVKELVNSTESVVNAVRELKNTLSNINETVARIDSLIKSIESLTKVINSQSVSIGELTSQMRDVLSKLDNIAKNIENTGAVVRDMHDRLEVVGKIVGTILGRVEQLTSRAEAVEESEE